MMAASTSMAGMTMRAGSGMAWRWRVVLVDELVVLAFVEEVGGIIVLFVAALVDIEEDEITPEASDARRATTVVAVTITVAETTRSAASLLSLRRLRARI